MMKCKRVVSKVSRFEAIVDFVSNPLSAEFAKKPPFLFKLVCLGLGLPNKTDIGEDTYG